MGMYRLSIVIPVYNAEGGVGSLVDALRLRIGSLYQLEFVLVNDGSADSSASVCRQLAEQYSEV